MRRMNRPTCLVENQVNITIVEIFSRLLFLFYGMPQVGAFKKLHDDISYFGIAGNPEVEHGDGIGMANLRGGKRLSSEAFNDDLIGGQMRVQDFDSDGVLDLNVGGAIHGPHAAFAD